MDSPQIQMPNIPRSDTEDERKAIRNELRAEAKRARSEMPVPYRAHKSAELCKRLEESLLLTLGITGTAATDAVIAVYSAFPEEVDLSDFIEAAYAQGCTVAFPCMIRDAWHSCLGRDTQPHFKESCGNNAAAQPVQQLQQIQKQQPQQMQKVQREFTQQTMEMRQVSAELFHAKQVPFLNNPLKRYCHDDEELQPYPYVPAGNLTMIVVPVVGFDNQGNRLGYGAGNYDRYLAQIAEVADLRFVEAESADKKPSAATSNDPDLQFVDVNSVDAGRKSPTCRIVGVAFAEQQVDTIPTEEHDIPLAILSL